MDGVWSGGDVSIVGGVLVIPRLSVLFLESLGDDVSHPLLVDLEAELDQYNVKWWYFNQRLNWLSLFENLVEL